MKDLLILVDENDNPVGFMDKISAHQKGILHRAFSIFIFNTKGELLLQQRAYNKYHSGGLWSNTCCSHPLINEEIDNTIKRRLEEEMGIKCNMHFQFSFIYKNEFENGLTEHELDYVYFGISDHMPVPNIQEVKDWKYISLEKLQKEILKKPYNFSSWLKICLPEVIKNAARRNKIRK